jgi:hypothetical protein
MSGPVIEPSEIITQADSVRFAGNRLNPLFRLQARFFDYSLFFAILQILTRSVHWPWIERYVLLEFLAWVPFEAVLLTIFGTTPGKWLLGIKLKKSTIRQRIDIRTAFKRAFLVWFRGVGLGVWYITFFCMLAAFRRLQVWRITSWDRDAHTFVTYHPVAKWRVYFVSLTVFVGMLFYSFWKKNLV